MSKITNPKENIYSSFCDRLKTRGRILEIPGYNVWCCSPIWGDDGKVHVFYSRWKGDFNYWVADCEVAHAVADHPEGPYTHVDVVLKGRGGDAWDAWSIHNPTVHKVGNQYAILFMGSTGEKLDITKADLPGMDWPTYEPYFKRLVETKRIGLAVSDSLYGPWRRVSDAAPLLDVSPEPAWDDVLTSNPALLQTPEGEFRLYYKSLDFKGWREYFGNRKYGVAMADNLEGPYMKYSGNPIINYMDRLPRSLANKSNSISKEKEYDFQQAQVEDAYVWYEDGKYRMLMRDMGFFNHEYGLYLESENGFDWSSLPQVGFRDSAYYTDEPMLGLPREGRFERPQLLFKDGRATHLFCAFRGGRYSTSSSFVFELTP